MGWGPTEDGGLVGIPATATARGIGNDLERRVQRSEAKIECASLPRLSGFYYPKIGNELVPEGCGSSGDGWMMLSPKSCDRSMSAEA